MGSDMIVQQGKGPPLWFKIYVIFGSFMVYINQKYNISSLSYLHIFHMLE